MCFNQRSVSLLVPAMRGKETEEEKGGKGRGRKGREGEGSFWWLTAVDAKWSKTGWQEGLGARLCLVKNWQDHCYHDYTTHWPMELSYHVLLKSKLVDWFWQIIFLHQASCKACVSSRCDKYYLILTVISNCGVDTPPWRFFNIFAYVQMLSSPCNSHATINGEIHFV